MSRCDRCLAAVDVAADDGRRIGGHRRTADQVESAAAVGIDREAASDEVDVGRAVAEGRSAGAGVKGENAVIAGNALQRDGARRDGRPRSEKQAGEQRGLRLLDDDLDGRGIGFEIAGGRWLVDSHGGAGGGVGETIFGRRRLCFGGVAGIAELQRNRGTDRAGIGGSLHRTVLVIPKTGFRAETDEADQDGGDECSDDSRRAAGVVGETRQNSMLHRHCRSKPRFRSSDHERSPLRGRSGGHTILREHVTFCRIGLRLLDSLSAKS